MEKIVELIDADLEDFIRLVMESAHGNDIWKISVALNGEGVSFKINESMWTYPLGKVRD